MKVLGVEFSPLSIPLERRLQTFAVFFWMGLFVVSTLLCLPWFLLAYLLLFSRLWLFALLYVAWLYHDIQSCNRQGLTNCHLTFYQRWVARMGQQVGSRLDSLGPFQGLLPHQDGQNCGVGPPEVSTNRY